MSTNNKHHSSGMSSFQAAKSSSMESLESSMSTTESTTGMIRQCFVNHRFFFFWFFFGVFFLKTCVNFYSMCQDIESARLATVLQENAVLKSELELLRLKCKNLVEENKRLRQASVTIVSDVVRLNAANVLAQRT